LEWKDDKTVSITNYVADDDSESSDSEDTTNTETTDDEQYTDDYIGS
jgi:hypothetical protein